MVGEDIRALTLDSMFSMAYGKRLDPASFARLLLSSKEASYFQKGSTQYFRYQEAVERIASSCPLVRGEPIFGEYSYLSFIIQSFLKETDLSIKRIGIILQPQALLMQYQHFHSMDERRVILQLMLRQGSKSFARKAETKMCFLVKMKKS